MPDKQEPQGPGGVIPPTDGDLVHITAGPVDDITAAVDALCACPCRRPIPPDGPSGWFAGPGCQQDWYSGRATDPEQVYDRVDAARHPRSDTDPAPLTRPGPASNTRARDRGLHDPDLSFRRRCDRCGRRVVPVTHEEVRVTVGGQVRPPNGATRGRWQACPRCRAPFPGPAYSAAVDEEQAGLRFRLADGTFWVSKPFRVAPTRHATRRAADRAWDRLVEQLASRHRGGYGGGMLATDPVLAMDYLLGAQQHLNPGDAVRVTGV